LSVVENRNKNLKELKYVCKESIGYSSTVFSVALTFLLIFSLSAVAFPQSRDDEKIALEKGKKSEEKI